MRVCARALTALLAAPLLSAFCGDVLLRVKAASRCGSTPQHRDPAIVSRIEALLPKARP